MTTRKDAIPRSPYSYKVRKDFLSIEPRDGITHVDPFHALPWVTLHVGVPGFPREAVQDPGIHIVLSNVIHNVDVKEMSN
jgi:hypothetical protein